jgi:hypothetical protein
VADITIKRGDRSPSVEATLRKAGVVVDLTGGTVQFVMKSKHGGTLKVNAAAVIVSASAGTVRYDWAAADVDTAGTYHAEFKFTLAGKIMSFPNDRSLVVVIEPDLD